MNAVPPAAPTLLKARSMPRERLINQFTDAANEEAELIGFLFDPNSYPDGADTVSLIETHAARVFLAGRKAIKIKKRIRLPFSTSRRLRCATWR